MTSLSQQLGRLQSSSTNILAEKLANTTKNITRNSLIYDNFDAAKLDYNQLYNLALDNLENLISHQKSLSNEIPDEIVSTFFAEKSQSLNRLNLTEEENLVISEKVSKLLSILQPFALHASTLHIIEWLIQRFYIQSFETNDFIHFFLPFHEQTAIFGKISRLYPEDSLPDKFYWLLAPFREGRPINFSSILRVCFKDENLLLNLSSICEKQLGNGPSSMFFLKLAIRVVTVCDDDSKSYKNVTDKLMPFVLKNCGQKNSGRDSYQLWKISLLIFSTILSKFPIDNKISNEIISKFLKYSKIYKEKHSHETAVKDAIILLAVYGVNQEHKVSEGMDQDLVKYLLRLDGFSDILMEYNEDLKTKGKSLKGCFEFLCLDERVYDILLGCGFFYSF